MNKLKIELLNKQHNKKNFNCNVEALNCYLKTMASQHSKKGISKTYILRKDDDQATILGYVTITACEIKSDTLPVLFAKKYPSKITGAKIARLAVAKPYQKQGLGKQLIISAMHQAMIVHKAVGITGVIVDAKEERVKEYYKKYNFIPLPDIPLTLFLPIKSIIEAFQIISE